MIQSVGLNVCLKPTPSNKFNIETQCTWIWGSQVVLVVKNLPANAGDIREAGSIPALGRSPGGGQGNPLQYSCLENPMDREAWWATVHGFAKNQTRLKRLCTHAHVAQKY